MKNENLYKGIIIFVVAIGLAVAIDSFTSGEVDRPAPTAAPEPVDEVEREETVEEQMARWDRGEFTPEEVAEIRIEEEREDAALESSIE